MAFETDLVFRDGQRGIGRAAVSISRRAAGAAVDHSDTAYAPKRIRRVGSGVDARASFSFGDMGVVTIDALGMAVVGGRGAIGVAGIFAGRMFPRRRNGMFVGFVELHFDVPSRRAVVTNNAELFLAGNHQIWDQTRPVAVVAVRVMAVDALPRIAARSQPWGGGVDACVETRPDHIHGVARDIVERRPLIGRQRSGKIMTTRGVAEAIAVGGKQSKRLTALAHIALRAISPR